MSNDNPMFWGMGDDDGFFGEDEEAFVSANDPLRAEEDPFSPFEKYPDAVTMAAVGAMCETENEKNKQTIFVDDDKVVEYISMEAHLRSKNPKQNTIVEKQPLRPFEQWLQDIRSGEKTIDDPL